MAFAAISTVFIALFLLGLTLLVRREVELITESIGGKVEISVFLRDDITPEQQTLLQEKLTTLPEVDDVRYESKDDAFARAQELFKNQPEILENLTPEALPASFRVKLNDPETQFTVITARLEGQPGIETINDQREVLDPLFKATGFLRTGLLVVAGLMLLSAGFLIANTVRVGLYARRKEIGIMKLVGATNWFIRAPFLIEGLVAALIGATFAIGVLYLLFYFSIQSIGPAIPWLPMIGSSDLFAVVPPMLGAGLVVAVLASFAGMRRFLDI